MSNPIRVLILEDRAADAELMLYELRQAGFDPHGQRVEIEPNYLAALETKPDLILADWSLPQFNGLRALQLMNERGLEIPFIVVSGSIGEEEAVQAIREGADDYLLKDRLARLGESVRRALEDKQLRDERNRAEDELRVSLIKYKTLFDCFPQGITVSDEAGNILETNSEAVRLLSVSEEDHKRRGIGDTEWKIVRPDGTPMPPEEFASVKAFKEKRMIENVEMGIVKADNTITWINVKAAPLPVEGYGVVVTYGDITERKYAEEALAESQARYRTFINATTDMAFLKDDHFRYLIVNETNARFFGKPVAEIIGKDDFELMDAEAAQACRRGDEQVLQDNELVIIVEEMDGRAYETRKFPVDLHDSRLGVGGYIRDITESRRAAAALRESQEKFRIAQDMSPDGFTILRPVRDAQERVVDFIWVYENAAVARFNGTDPEAVVGRRLLELFPNHRGTQFLRAYQQVAESGETCIFESGYSGESMTTPTSFRIVVVPMAGDIAVLAQDITERMQAEDEIKKQLDELQRWHNATLGREMRVLELKREVNELLGKAGQPPRYPSAE